MPKRKGYPQIIKSIHVNENGYLWIGVGECNFDNLGRIKVINTIDIFNTEGKYLYTFKTPLCWMKETVIKYGRLYTMPVEFDRFIHVYKINYNI